jgi:hypothetical protein
MNWFVQSLDVQRHPNSHSENLFLTVALIGLGLQIDERSLRICPQAG